ncbi:MAG: DUF3987 domain-containing protein, partial [Clostridiaceae bacterium]|nr:DUF3987 domain-containing protein [Clostridiaceae bacterium]
NLYLLTLADSGERKSTLDAFFSKAIREFELNLTELMRDDVNKYHAGLASWEAQRNGLLTGIRDAAKKMKPVMELEVKLKELEKIKPVKPIIPRYLTGDSTIEALTWRLHDQWPVAGLLSSEGGIFCGGPSMTNDNLIKNLSVLNSLWGAEHLIVDRKTSNSYTLESVRLSIGLSIQPETFMQFINSTKGLARGSGFLARFLIAMPTSSQGLRTFKEAPEHWPNLSLFHERLNTLLNMPLSKNAGGYLEPIILKLSPEAKQVWVNFYNDVEGELLPGGLLEEAKDIASKAADNLVRLATIFHIFETGLSGHVTAECVSAAARIITWHLMEAKRFLSEVALPVELSNALKLNHWLLDYCKKNNTSEITTRQVLQYGPSSTRQKRNLDSALLELQSLNRIRVHSVNKKILISINPELLEVR